MGAAAMVTSGCASWLLAVCERVGAWPGNAKAPGGELPTPDAYARSLTRAVAGSCQASAFWARLACHTIAHSRTCAGSTKVRPRRP